MSSSAMPVATTAFTIGSTASRSAAPGVDPGSGAVAGPIIMDWSLT